MSRDDITPVPGAEPELPITPSDAALEPEVDEQPQSRRFSVHESKASTICGIVFMCLGVLVFLVIIPWQVKAVSAAEWYNSPRFFPNCIAGLIFILGCCLLVSGLRQRKIPIENQKEYSISLVELKLVLITFGLLAIYTIALKWVPYIPATIVILAAMIWCYGQRKIVKIIAASVGMPVIIYFAFTYLLKLRLP